MLLNLHVRNFAIIDEIDLDLGKGMTVLTGETGAGKSILVDALGLVLGERGGSGLVREGAKRAEFSAEFDVRDHPDALAWLAEQALDMDGECLLRRVIGTDGRSRAFINGNAVTLQSLKAIGELLADIHGQHFHQSLGRRSIQRDILDHYGDLLELRRDTAACFAEWRDLRTRIAELRAAESERESRLDLLEFQVNELDALDLHSDELDSLTAERQKLQNVGRLAEGLARILDETCDGDEATAQGLIAAACQRLQELSDYDEALGPALALLEEAGIQLAEATDLLHRYADTLDADPARRDWVEERLHAVQTVARKHRVEPRDLGDVQSRLRDELDRLRHAGEQGEALEHDAAAAKMRYFELARDLSTGRHAAAASFASAVSNAMSGLGMPGGSFEVSLSPRDETEAKADGVDGIEFLIGANPGQPLMPLAKVASGGELSRMSLAIQVIASDGSRIPTMVFDEVDSGVGGGVAEMVGRRLAELGRTRQVLCVTHLPQVASQADHHLRINKVTDGKSTRTGISRLVDDERIEELARMLGGVEITQRTREHAAEMLASGGGKARKKRASR
jgi:DNA repair protein RecN (Recombination protein N)